MISLAQALTYLQDGRLVLLTLDPMAMLEPDDDAGLQAQCAMFKGKKYLAVIGLRAFQTTEGTHDEIEFHVISPTPAKDISNLGVTRTMYTPVFPSDDHPFREPLLPGGPALPAGRYYYHSHNSAFILRVSKAEGFRPAHHYTCLSLDELARLDENALEDAEKIAANIERPFSPFKSSPLPRSTAGSTTSSSHTSSILNLSIGSTPAHSTSSDSFDQIDSHYVPRSHFKPLRGGWQASDWYASAPSSHILNDAIPGRSEEPDIELGDVGKKFKDRNVEGRPFNVKVKVSLDLREMNPGDLSSSTELAEEIEKLYFLFLDHCVQDDTDSTNMQIENWKKYYRFNVGNPSKILAIPCRKIKNKVSQVSFHAPNIIPSLADIQNTPRKIGKTASNLLRKL